jgi:RNA polymerase sigma-70 factor (ECF subfamily)
MLLHTDDDAAAIRRCRSGDIRGLDALMARHQVQALRVAYLLTGNRMQAEDVVQDSFLQVFRTIKHFRPDRPFAPWLHGIVAHVARQRLRGSSRRREVSLNALSSAGSTHASDAMSTLRRAPLEGSDPVEAAELAEQRRALLDALSALTQKQREAVVLRYYAGCNDRELASILGCSSGTARQRVHAGLAALERVIRERYAWLLTEAPSGNAAKGEVRHA